jgi:Na+-transporting NADH:ubiquinone oxidoreductase subunit C
MRRDGNAKAFLVVLLVASVCSALVAASVVVLRPIQLNNQLLERSRNIMQLTGMLEQGETLQNDEMLALFKQLDARVVDIDAGVFDEGLDADTFDQRRAATRLDTSTEIPSDLDMARLGRRSKHATVYLVWQDAEIERIILPMHGAGMWSTLYGLIALESDLNTIAAATFYEQAETPGLGDAITRPDWLALWQGRQVYNKQGELAFGIGPGRIDPSSAAGQHRVDALTGATVTADSVTALVHYWLGPHGFQPFLQKLRDKPPQRKRRQREEES